MGDKIELLRWNEPIIPDLKLIAGLETAERFNGLREAVFSGLGPQFWGIRLDPETGIASSRPDSKMYRWMDLKFLIHTVPELTDKTARNIDMNYYDLLKIAERQMATVLEDKIAEDHLSLGVTYGEAFQIPSIRQPAITALQELGDPHIAAVQILEEWRMENYDSVNDEQKDLGRATFESFLFATGDEMFIPALGAAATAYLKTK